MRRYQRRTNLLWGLVLVAVSLVLVLRALNAIPEGVYDILSRAWPVLLVLAGLSALLRDRLPFGSFLALVLCVALVGGLTAMAFSSRATQPREDYQAPVAQIVGEDVSLLVVDITTLSTDVEVLRVLGDARSISGQFTGSSESHIETEYTEEDGGRAVFRLIETQPNQFPLLEAIGRGRLRLELPADLALDVVFRGTSGLATFNLAELALERLNIVLDKGDALVTLPEYKPLSPTAAQQPGNLTVREGNVTIFVPSGVAARFELNRGGNGVLPQFPDPVYFYLQGDILQSRAFDNADIQLRYVITAPRGLIRVEEASS
jgi:hypothetical protein